MEDQILIALIGKAKYLKSPNPFVCGNIPNMKIDFYSRSENPVANSAIIKMIIN